MNIKTATTMIAAFSLQGCLASGPVTTDNDPADFEPRNFKVTQHFPEFGDGTAPTAQEINDYFDQDDAAQLANITESNGLPETGTVAYYGTATMDVGFVDSFAADMGAIVTFGSQSVELELSDFAVFSIDPDTLGAPPSRVEEVFSVIDAGFSGTGTFTTEVDEIDPDRRDAIPFDITGDMTGTDQGGNPFDLSGTLDAYVSIWNIDGETTLLLVADGTLDGTGADQTGAVSAISPTAIAVGYATDDIPVN